MNRYLDDDDDDGDDDDDLDEISEEIAAKNADTRNKKMLKQNAAAHREELERLAQAVSDYLNRLSSDTQSQADRKIGEARRAALIFLSKTAFFRKPGEADNLPDLELARDSSAKPAVLEPDDAFSLAELQKFMDDTSGRTTWPIETVFRQLRSYHGQLAVNAGDASELAAARELLQKKSDELGRHSQRIESLEVERSNLREQLGQANASASSRIAPADHQAALDQLNEQQAQTREQLTANHESILGKELQKQAEASQAQLAQVERRCSEAIQRKQAELDAANQSIESLNRSKPDLSTQKRDMETEILSLRSQIASGDQQKNDALEDFEGKISGYLETIGYLRSLNTELNTSKSELVRQKDDVEGQRDSARANSDRLQEALAMAMKEKDSDSSRLTGKIEGMEKQLEGKKEMEEELRSLTESVVPAMEGELDAARFKLDAAGVAERDLSSKLTRADAKASRLENERMRLEAECRALRIADETKAESLKAADQRYALLQQSAEESRRSQQILAAKSSQDIRGLLDVFLPMVRSWPEAHGISDDQCLKNITEGIRQVRSTTIEMEPQNAVAESTISWDLAILHADLVDAFPVDKLSPVRLWLHTCGCSEVAADGAVCLIEATTKALAAQQEFDSDAPRFVFVAACMMVAHTKSAFRRDSDHRLSLRLATMRAIELCLRFAIPPSAPEIRELFKDISFFVPDETRKDSSPIGALWRWLNDVIVENKAAPFTDYLATVEASAQLNETEDLNRILIPGEGGIMVLDRDRKTMSSYSWEDFSWTFDCSSDDGIAYDVISFDQPRRPERTTPPFRVRSTVQTMMWVPKHMAPAVENARLRRLNDPHDNDFLNF
ncbi:hypothetical protein NU219Hw_g1889t1 [Hortaea werneckii]